MNLVEISGVLFMTRVELREEIVKEVQGAPSMKKIENNKKYQRLQLVNKLLAEIEGLLEKSQIETVASKYATMKRIVRVLEQQDALKVVISQQGLKQKSIRDNFAKYLHNALCLSGKEMTSKEVKQLAENVGYQVRNIGDFLKMVTENKRYRIIKVGRGKYKAALGFKQYSLKPGNLFTFSSRHDNLLKAPLKGGV